MDRDYEEASTFAEEEVNRLTSLEGDYDNYADEMEDVIENIIAKIHYAQHAIERSSVKRNLIYGIDHRVKEFPSTIEKCGRRGHELSIESIKEKILDVGGIRIITYYEDDIYKIVDILRHIPGIRIVGDEKDYVKKPKPNGYQSYHVHISTSLYSPTVEENVQYVIEIQIRDIGMDNWAVIDHDVKYKKDLKPEVAKKVEEMLKHAADLQRQAAKIAMEVRDLAAANNLDANTEADQGGSSSVLT